MTVAGSLASARKDLGGAVGVRRGVSGSGTEWEQAVGKWQLQGQRGESAAAAGDEKQRLVSGSGRGKEVEREKRPPMRMEGGLVKELLLVKDPMMCCYGVMPKINEWVVVKMIGAGVKPLMDVPITFEGKLRVGEMYENGYLTGVYLLEGEKLVGVKG